ncbi:MAG: acyl-CoA synthetase (NDP forming) [Paracoccaceae bacterium]|jgi:acyl-CoA synthetase (NDP forming)
MRSAPSSTGRNPDVTTPDRAPSLERLFRPRSVALIGASSDPAKIGGRPLHFLVKHGFKGDIWPVNPRAKEIGGVRCYPDIESLPGAPDVAMVLVGPAHAETSIRALAARGTGAAIVLAGGFAESGGDGIVRQASLIEAAGGMRLLGPNTIGLLNMTDDITLSASGALDVENRLKGGVAVVSQSGGILGSLMSRAATQGVGLSHLIATGNEADIDAADAVAYLAQDKATRVIALYLETIRKPVQFREAAAAVAVAGKKLVIYKVGRSEAGARSAASHTGALAGEDRVFDAYFRQIGAIRAARYSDLIDIPAALAVAPKLAGNRIAIVTHTGGAAGLVADVCGMAGFETPAPSAETTQRLAAILQDDGFAPDRNPVDLTLAGLDPEVTYQAIMALAQSDEFDAVIPVVGSSSVGRPHLVADPVIRAMQTVRKPLIVYTSPSAPGIVSRLNAAGVPTFDAPEACATALAALRHAIPTRIASGADDTPTVPVPFPAQHHDRTGNLNEAEAKQLFAAFGIGIVRETVISTAADAPAAAANLGDRVVIKILARDLLHKTEADGVRLNVPPENAEQVCKEIAADALAAGVSPQEGFLIQEQVGDAAEMIIGFRRDPVLGPALLLGAGGRLAELHKDFEICLLPATGEDIREVLESLKITTVLKGYRGQPPADIDALVDAVAGFSRMCMALGERLEDAEMNPLFVKPEGQGVAAADGVVVLTL